MLSTNVLIIDDSKLITKLITKALLTNKIDNHHFDIEHIFIAHDGMQAFKILGQNSKITLVISDVMMPILDGEELIEMLIDIDKIDNLDLFFITTQIVAKSMNSRSKEFTAGILHKPFNNDSFNQQFNQMQIINKNKIEEHKKIKIIHAKQKRYITSWINRYFEQTKHNTDYSILDKLIESEFKHFDKIDDSELFMISNLVVESYFLEIADEISVDISLLKEIYNAWMHPDENSSLEVNQDFNNIISNAKEILDESSSKEDMMQSVLEPINRMIIQLANKVKSNKELSYTDFFSYFPNIIEIFSSIDDNYQKKRTVTIINRVDEVQKLHESLNLLVDDAVLIDMFPFLEQNNETLEILKRNFKILTKKIETKVIPFYVNEINSSIWKAAKKSPKIVAFIKNNLKKKMPSTHNILYHFDKIQKEDMNKFEKYNTAQLSVVSNNMEMLGLFKYNLLEYLPNMDVSVFSSASILQRSIEKIDFTKLIIDLDFKDSVFNNGLQLLKFLQKRYPTVEKLIKSSSIYLLVSSKQVEILHNRKDKSDYNIILKKINKNNIYDKVFWEV